MISFKNVSFSYDQKEFLHEVDFKMEDGEFVGVLGPNGGGKSTFLKLSLGLLKPLKGEVTLKERRVSYIPQTTSIEDRSFPCTVEEAVSLGLIAGKKFFLNKRDKATIKAVLIEFGLYDLRHHLLDELSGGQMQRAKIAKALAGDPSLLVLDEPDTGMDEESHEQLMDCLSVLKERKTGILFVSHHPHDLHDADRIVFIEDGKILSYEEELERGHHHVSL